jgi:alcohol dehydrogenase YqhD (iron-dependent ADH family)
MRNFNFETTTKILFGKDKVFEMIPEIKAHGSRVLLAYGCGSIMKIGLYDQIVKLLNDNGIYFCELSGIQPNPRISSVREGVRICRENKLDFILAAGGGSVIDCCKAIAAGVSYQGDAWDFMMQKGSIKNPLPIGSILTLAATGSEMNGSAVITNEETQEKRAMGSPKLCPVFSVLDPSYTFTVDKWHTAAGVTDIMSHIFELYFTPDKGTHVQDMLAEGLMRTCIHYGPIAVDCPDDYDARANLMWASTLALNGILGAGKLPGDWASHMIEHEVSAIYDLTHGAGLAIIFPTWMEYVLCPENAWKFAQMARNVWCIDRSDDMSAAVKGIGAVRNFFSSLGMPVLLSEVEIDDSQLGKMGEKACVFGPIGLLRKLDSTDVTAILANAM